MRTAELKNLSRIQLFERLPSSYHRPPYPAVSKFEVNAGMHGISMLGNQIMFFHSACSISTRISSPLSKALYFFNGKSAGPRILSPLQTWNLLPCSGQVTIPLSGSNSPSAREKPAWGQISRTAQTCSFHLKTAIGSSVESGSLQISPSP